MPFKHRLGIVLNFDVGIDAVALDDPVPVGRGEAELGDIDDAAVNQRAAIGDADHAAPRSLADQRAQLRLLEHRREDVAVGR